MDLTTRDKAILCGLFLSKCNYEGTKRLGFSSFKEAFNILGLAIGVKPSSIKNYRDELDPLFPNSRQGWHGRPLRGHCEKIYSLYKDFEIEELISLIAQFTGCKFEGDADGKNAENPETFVKRLLTGKAAEKYFISNFQREEDFAQSSIKDVTQTGCGFDFNVICATSKKISAVEVKGLSGTLGSISLTNKEYMMALNLKELYYLYVVRNFEEIPTALNIKNPLNSKFKFIKRERKIIQTTWQTNI